MNWKALHAHATFHRTPVERLTSRGSHWCFKMVLQYYVCVDFEATCWTGPGDFSQIDRAEIIGRRNQQTICVPIKKRNSFHFKSSQPFSSMRPLGESKPNFISSFVPRMTRYLARFVESWLASLSRKSIDRLHFQKFTENFRDGSMISRPKSSSSSTPQKIGSESRTKTPFSVRGPVTI